MHLLATLMWVFPEMGGTRGRLDYAKAARDRMIGGIARQELGLSLKRGRRPDQSVGVGGTP